MKNKNILVLIPILFIVIGQISSKYGMDLSKQKIGYYFLIFLAVGYAALILRGFVWIYILKKIELSKAYPMMSFSYVIIMVLSYFIFSESINLDKILGAIFITAGTLLVGKNENYNNN